MALTIQERIVSIFLPCEMPAELLSRITKSKQQQKKKPSNPGSMRTEKKTPAHGRGNGRQRIKSCYFSPLLCACTDGDQMAPRWRSSATSGNSSTSFTEPRFLLASPRLTSPRQPSPRPVLQLRLAVMKDSGSPASLM